MIKHRIIAIYLTDILGADDEGKNKKLVQLVQGKD